MKKLIILSILIIISCSAENKGNKEVKALKNKGDIKKMEIQRQNKIETSDLEEFFKNYSYLDSILIKSDYFDMNDSSQDILKKYIESKEKKMIKLENSSQIFDNEPKEKRIKKIISILLELEEKVTNHDIDWLLNKEDIYKYLINEISEYNYKLPESKLDEDRKSSYRKSFFEFLEKNYSKDQIEKILEVITINPEYLSYDIDGRYGLKKVDEVISELEKYEPITSEEWSENEARSGEKVFKNQIENTLAPAYILTDNRIVIVDMNDNNKPVKEIKITDYKKVGIILYKNIIYIYDNGMIYEYSGRKFENVKKIKVM